MNEVKQMKKRKRALQKACSLFIMFMLTLTTLKAVGGTIDIHLKDFPNAEKAGVTFTLYKVGSMSDDGKAALYEKYDMHLPDTAEGLQKVAKELTQKTDKETIGKRTTDEKGYLSFTNIENGIYLLVPSDMESYGTIDPFIVTLPMYEEIANVIQGPSYYLQVEPKALPNEAEKPHPPVDREHPQAQQIRRRNQRRKRHPHRQEIRHAKVYMSCSSCFPLLACLSYTTSIKEEVN